MLPMKLVTLLSMIEPEKVSPISMSPIRVSHPSSAASWSGLVRVREWDTA